MFSNDEETNYVISIYSDELLIILINVFLLVAKRDVVQGLFLTVAAQLFLLILRFV